MSFDDSISRKDFIRKAGLVFGGTGLVTSGFPSLLLSSSKSKTSNGSNGKLGVALVGLGGYATGQLAPALQQTEHCELRGIVTGSPWKIPVWQDKYGIPDGNVYNYQTMSEIANNDDIDVIYIVLPPSMHAEYSIKAAETGKHVWCEKPMAMNEQECRSMIEAADNNGVQLTVGYRMQHEPNTQTIIRYGENETYGTVQSVRAGAGYNGRPGPDSWRDDAEMGGGALYDMGVYAINGARYATGLEPIAVRGRQWSERAVYSEVDEFTEFELRFPEGVTATGETSFGKSVNYLDVECTDGWYRLSPMQSYSGVQGETSDGTQLRPCGCNQQALQMDDDALAIKEGKAPIVPGEEGLRDIRIVRAIMESSENGQEWIEL
ncbi:Gfo/Idh/MocA family oxidoreductase [Balneolaceae bacterium YR4-1]|uniref:Gfo/Idh/MocA family oxidoreductase n=1 Tax=Halalkalibaculum roseum TaxID=2709311 RepID=A0A6M1SSM1_9BACT|nr:Gfo/Idh/MocA family oxidoreductase [Halalkalibaculum roseum]NGP75088.1 Gfo/Idh/MocA family oxidoreductase [Halalkalibaculum roseum]